MESTELSEYQDCALNVLNFHKSNFSWFIFYSKNANRKYTLPIYSFIGDSKLMITMKKN